jgi:hypothetical protein
VTQNHLILKDAPPVTFGKSPFSRKEVESIVKGFFMAWERGDIEVIWPLAEDLHKTSQYLPHGREITVKQAVKLEIDNKQEFLELIRIFTRSRAATPREVRWATYSLFNWITTWRAADRIKDNKGNQGRFLEYGIEDKMRDLERKLDVTEQLVRQLIEEVKTGKKKP